jgi:hypothetical protein
VASDAMLTLARHRRSLGGTRGKGMVGAGIVFLGVVSDVSGSSYDRHLEFARLFLSALFLVCCACVGISAATS